MRYFYIEYLRNKKEKARNLQAMRELSVRPLFFNGCGCLMPTNQPGVVEVGSL